MMMHADRCSLFATVLMGACGSAAVAGPVFMVDFEGVSNLAQVRGFYAGGTDSLGAGPGVDRGVEFSLNALGLVDSDAGGTGQIGNEPSGNTALIFLTGTGFTMNLADGFDTGFGISYASPEDDGAVRVYSGLDGTGTLLGSALIRATGEGAGDPTGRFSAWDRAGVTFAGTARSVVVEGVANFMVFDDASFGSTVPAPAGIAVGALCGLTATRRRR